MSDLFMNKSSDDWNKLKHLVDLSAENARLKAEVERLRKVFEITERLMLRDGEYEAAKVGTYANLKAEVERLRKAGDAMAAHILKIEEEVYEVTPCGGYYVIDEWNAAKEGKPSV